MALLTVLTVIAVGLVVGIVSGLVGIGGGVLIVPFLYFFYDNPAIFGVHAAPETRIILAHGTSLFVIVPTAIRGAYAFHRRGLVEWRAVWPTGIGSVVAAAAGARVALVLPPEMLRIAFGVFLVFSGVQLVLRRGVPARVEEASGPRLSPALMVAAGGLIGLFSALLGVGGGIVAIPILMYVVRLEVRRVAATSMGIIAITATAGAASYMIIGIGTEGLPPGSVGFVDIFTGLAMFAGAVTSVRWGAQLNQRLSPRTLAMVFAALFLLLGTRLIVGGTSALFVTTDQTVQGVTSLHF
ncbi:sulfite exporter TauE/SafE family protein [soil metagenome]